MNLKEWNRATAKLHAQREAGKLSNKAYLNELGKLYDKLDYEARTRGLTHHCATCGVNCTCD